MSFAAPLGTTFTYQGRLDDGGAQATGQYDFRFLLYDASFGGSQRGSTITNLATLVTGGLFTSPLDFGTNVFAGEERWLEIHVRTNGSGAFAALSPRQPLTSIPYSLYSTAAGFAASAVSANTAGAATTAVTANVANSAPWTGLTAVPAGFADGIDNDTTYTAGAGLSLVGTTFAITSAGVDASRLADGAVTSVKLQDSAVGTSKLADGSVTTSKFVDSSVTSAKIVDGGITTSKLDVTGALAGQTLLFDGSSVTWSNVAWGGLTGVPAGFADGIDNDTTYSAGAGLTLSGANQFNVNFGGSGSAVTVSRSDHTHSGADITSGTVTEARIESAIARTTQIVPTVLANDGTGSGLDADLLDGLDSAAFASATHNHDSRYWKLGGNSGTLPVANFLGTTDGQRLELRVNNQVALRVWPTSETPNWVGGYDGNASEPGVRGAVIGGGGRSGGEQVIGANYAFIGGGEFNTIQTNARYSVISGGLGNKIQPNSSESAIGGGSLNEIQIGAYLSVISGGVRNTIQTNSNLSTIGGGADNSIRTLSYYSVIGGGLSNTVGLYYSTIDGGFGNTNLAGWSAIGGGANNLITNFATGSTIGGGWNNQILDTAYHSAIAGGSSNTIQGFANRSSIGGGSANEIQFRAAASTIGGGYLNGIGANSTNSAIGGGEGNDIADLSANSTIAGGFRNAIDTFSFNSAIGGGYFNTIGVDSGRSTIAGGSLNDIDARNSAIGGGFNNTIADDSESSTIAGGVGNRIATNSFASAIGGGERNTIAANAQYATIPGGVQNTATNYALAAGRRAKANHQGAFVWADSQNSDFASSDNNQFLIRASGGVGFNTANLLGRVTAIYSRSGSFNDSIGYFENSNTGASTSPAMRVIANGDAPEGALSVSTQGTGLIARFGNASVFVSALSTDGTWTALAFNPTSDRNAKENFAPVNSREVLDKVVALPVSRWNYKAAPGLEHIGPVAQDFHAAFGLNGADDKHIATVDSDGVALAAIQGLNEKFEEQLKLQCFKLEAKDAQIKLLNERLERLEKMLGGLPPRHEGEP